MDSAAASAAHASGDLIGSAQAWEAVEAAEAAEAASMIASTGSSHPLRALCASRGDHACAPAARRGREPRSEPGGSRPIAADRPPGARHRTGLAPRRHGRSARGPCGSRHTEPAGSRARGRARRPAQPGVHPGPAGGPAAGAAGALLPYCPIAPFDIVYRFDRGTDAAADSRLAFFASIDDPTHLPASRGHHAREAAPRIRSTPQRQNDRTTDRIAAREPPLRLAAGLRSISTETCP
ncbi:hypothetical protein [Burkholderia mallei]|uniref:Uncharacterized protein n=2 Tax=Burkholderia mallei TaxID=13373 RepID=A0AAX1X9K6_BURML|nr:hypothetical protein [Burkholderia mallei]AAU50196.1 hypothetical protein BMA2376 [Burkholderia mallei ATCC 23344]AIO52486.1 hypothetical protein DM55_1412 [Burkholderia mallei]AIO57313.1 hypothetical protein DM78_554 [Burkholderia mallei]AIO63739.1 hypothetical protein DM76_1389 [Burkholderia mallei]AIP76203.1 hypothetical protein DM51_2015 [Burkholderia mallei]